MKYHPLKPFFLAIISSFFRMPTSYFYRDTSNPNYRRDDCGGGNQNQSGKVQILLNLQQHPDLETDSHKSSAICCLTSTGGPTEETSITLRAIKNCRARVVISAVFSFKTFGLETLPFPLSSEDFLLSIPFGVCIEGVCSFGKPLKWAS